MPNKAILCYICSWSHGSVHVYSLGGGLVPGSSGWLVLFLWGCKPLQLLQSFFYLFQWGPHSPFDGCLQASTSVFVMLWKSLSGDSYISLLSACISWHQQYCLSWLCVYGLDPQVGQALNGFSFSLCSKLCLRISSYEYFCFPFKKDRSIHTLVIFLLELHVVCGLYHWVIQALGLISTYQWVHTMCVYFCCCWVTSFRMVFSSSIHLPMNFMMSLFLKIYLFYFMYSILPAYVTAGQKKAPDLITDGCEPPCGCWELNSWPLEEQSGALNLWAISLALIIFDSWVVLHCVDGPHFLYPFLCWRASGFFPASGYYK